MSVSVCPSVCLSLSLSLCLCVSVLFSNNHSETCPRASSIIPNKSFNLKCHLLLKFRLKVRKWSTFIRVKGIYGRGIARARRHECAGWSEHVHISSNHNDPSKANPASEATKREQEQAKDHKRSERDGPKTCSDLPCSCKWQIATGQLKMKDRQQTRHHKTATTHNKSENGNCNSLARSLSRSLARSTPNPPHRRRGR